MKNFTVSYSTGTSRHDERRFTYRTRGESFTAVARRAEVKVAAIPGAQLTNIKAEVSW